MTWITLSIVWDKCHNQQPITIPKIVGWLFIVVGGIVIQRAI